MCKALYDMPGDQAVEAVERFAMVDLDKVRSKTGFMVSTRNLVPFCSRVSCPLMCTLPMSGKRLTKYSYN